MANVPLRYQIAKQIAIVVHPVAVLGGSVAKKESAQLKKRANLSVEGADYTDVMVVTMNLQCRVGGDLHVETVNVNRYARNNVRVITV